MRKGDIAVAHQGKEGILGLAYLASNGYPSDYEEQYDCFDLKPSPTLPFDKLVSYNLIKELPDAIDHIEFICHGKRLVPQSHQTKSQY